MPQEYRQQLDHKKRIGIQLDKKHKKARKQKQVTIEK